MTSRDSERGRTSTMRIVDGLFLDGAEPDVVGIAAASGLPREEVEEIIATRRLLLAEGLLAPSAHVDAEAASLEVPDSEDPTTPPFARWIEERIGAAPVGAKRPGHLGRWVLDGPGTDHPLGAWFPAYERDGTLEADVLLLRADTPSGVVDRVFHASGLARGLEGGVWVAAYETGFEDDLGYLAFEPEYAEESDEPVRDPLGGGAGADLDDDDDAGGDDESDEDEEEDDEREEDEEEAEDDDY